MQFTTQMKIDSCHKEFLEASTQYTGTLRARLLTSLLKKESGTELKKKYIAEYGVTARQFNSLISEVRGIISSAEELRKRNIEEAKIRIASCKKRIKTLEKKLKDCSPACGINGNRSPRKSVKFAIHQKKRRQGILEARLKKLQTKVSICLGGKKLFKAQYNLEANGYESHQEWLEDFRHKRNNRVFYIGSKDESFGNQNCQLIGNKLLIRVLPHLQAGYGDCYTIANISFAYGKEEVTQAIAKKQAINYRLIYKKKNWYLQLTTQREDAPQITRKELGAIGIDLNPSHLSWAEVNRHGNLIAFGNIPTPLQDRRSDQVKATLGDAIKEIVEYAKKVQKPIVVEELDFSKKKAKLKEYSVRYRRMLSYFAYSLFFLMLISKALRAGVQVITTNPAYSSLIGKFKFMSMYGLCTHLAASLVLARRAFGFSERLPAKYALGLAEHKYRHVWSFWRAFSKAVSNREPRVGLVSRQPGANPSSLSSTPGLTCDS